MTDWKEDKMAAWVAGWNAMIDAALEGFGPFCANNDPYNDGVAAARDAIRDLDASQYAPDPE